VSLEDFELVRVIGKGSFGKVTLVRKKNDQKLYAMKVLSKPNIIKRKQVEHTKTERRVLGTINHPFIVRLHYAFQTEEKLYFVLDYAAGGELFFHLSRMKKFTESTTRFYCAEITMALDALHLHVIFFPLLFFYFHEYF
jgi:serine/threonine protein kinase